MSRNRLFTEEPMFRIPQAPPAPVTPEGFVMCPQLVLCGLNPQQQWLYQRAFELAQVVIRPSLPERDLLGVWN